MEWIFFGSPPSVVFLKLGVCAQVSVGIRIGIVIICGESHDLLTPFTLHS